MATPSASAELRLSVAQATDQVRLMSDADKLRFIKASTYLSFGGARSPTDLRQEAIRRVLAGTRTCPNSLPIIIFLNGVMRSIAWADRKSADRAPKLTAVPNDASTAQSMLDGADPRLSPEDRTVQEDSLNEIKGKILALFDDDPVAQMIADGMMSEIEGEQLRDIVELTEKDFATKRRLVRRRIGKAFPDGIKS